MINVPVAVKGTQRLKNLPLATNVAMLNALSERKGKRWSTYWTRHPYHAAIIIAVVGAVYSQSILYPLLIAVIGYWIIRVRIDCSSCLF